MAGPVISSVRRQTGEMDESSYTDTAIEALVQEHGVTGAIATIWEQKAAAFAEAVDVAEAGASHAFSGLFKNAQSMANYWNQKWSEEHTSPVDAPRVRLIERS